MDFKDALNAYYSAYVREGMRRYGGQSPHAFSQLMEDEPDLLVPLIQSYGIPCRSASILNVRQKDVTVKAVMPWENTKFLVVFHFCDAGFLMN